ncbi:guanosine-3',5'-bis(diphosphate) 3'-pyrophosphohydrolase MESH1 [Xenopus laevis]|uniref:Guanosine-3',5'-bis(Diphosphate) 3'-pyrophosphohydrolase MESH1 n=2 Tax=Xenopus laevis TaxID=8355 RepID=A0A8J1KRV3_XENLA|nr:guanosine-3',5'-bis(diphosphate) 3'-pyrophosphohydrolase MESH1 [Xenopus laevis]
MHELNTENVKYKRSFILPPPPHSTHFSRGRGGTPQIRLAQPTAEADWPIPKWAAIIPASWRERERERDYCCFCAAPRHAPPPPFTGWGLCVLVLVGDITVHQEETACCSAPCGVARILSHEAGITDTAVLQAALLHNIVEDTITTFAEIELHFGQDVRNIVEKVTDDKTLPKMERKKQQIAHAPHCSHKAKLVKLANKLYNLRYLKRCTPEGWSEERVQEYFQWVSQVLRGLRGTNSFLEAKLDHLFIDQGIAV